jgi:hypothetical protein
MNGESFFKIIGPFFVASLVYDDNDIGVRRVIHGNNYQEPFKRLYVGKHGMESVAKGKRTRGHRHDFPSFYKADGLDVKSDRKIFTLPEKALVLILPGIHHSWMPKSKTGGRVGSIDDRHEKQVIVSVV